VPAVHRNPSTEARIAHVRRFLVSEGSLDGSAHACATAAGRVHDKLTAQLSPLLGAAGVRALFVRSAKLAQSEVAGLAEAQAFESSKELRGYLQAVDPVVAAKAAEVLFGTFIALLTTFIGARLSTQALRGAWPSLADSTSTENET
jgi:hypothetical protein